MRASRSEVIWLLAHRIHFWSHYEARNHGARCTKCGHRYDQHGGSSMAESEHCTETGCACPCMVFQTRAEIREDLARVGMKLTRPTVNGLR